MQEFREAVWEELLEMAPQHREILLVVLIDLWKQKPINLSDIARSLGWKYTTAHDRLEAALLELGKRLSQRPDLVAYFEEQGLSPVIVVEGIVGRLLGEDRNSERPAAD